MANLSARALLRRSPRARRVAGGAWRKLRTAVEGSERTRLEERCRELLDEMSVHDRRMLTELYDDRGPLPESAASLSHDNRRLRQLRAEYAACDLAIAAPSLWEEQHVGDLELRYFRGESPYVWNYREWPRAMTLKYFIWTEYIRSIGGDGLLTSLGEDGAFGCWTFQYPGSPRVSRDLLDSVNEILFLERHVGVLDRPGLRILDIGAGYGRSGHRMVQANPGISDYCCVDVIPESTFLSEYYLDHRGARPPARVVPLTELPEGIRGDRFDCAINIHSFSECTTAAIEWWMELLADLQVPWLLIVPNDGDRLLAFEADGSRRDFRPMVEHAGYTLDHQEPVIRDEAVRELLGLPYHFMLFRRVSS